MCHTQFILIITPNITIRDLVLFGDIYFILELVSAMTSETYRNAYYWQYLLKCMCRTGVDIKKNIKSCA